MQKRASYDASGITITSGKTTFASACSGDDSDSDNNNNPSGSGGTGTGAADSGSSSSSGGGSTPNFRIKIGCGIAGFVASTGKGLNIPDAYQDVRFDQSMDKKIDERVTYVTKSVLATPIFDPERNIVGVTKLYNKLKPENRGVIAFGQSDIQIMQAFSTFCGLALHRTIMYEALEKERERLAITMEIMSYHATARVDEAGFFETLLKENPVDISVISQPDFDPHIFAYADDRLPVIMYNMFEDLGFRQKYKISEDKMAKYILTVRKNYRGNQYHNFTHATCVAHALYLLAKQDILTEFGFSDLEIYAMFIAAFNHDIDHRGTNNTFQKAAHTSLASFYSSSTMERHHFNHAMTILNAPGHNILETMRSEEYKLCLEIIEKAILATDMALFFKNKSAAQELANSKSYNPRNPQHKDLLLSISLTCSDLSAMSKKWENSQKTADSVYAEFFAQGDEEKKLGLPISADIMNRENEHQIPKMQVDFYKFIVFPAFQIFNGIIGEKSNHLMEEVKNNAKHWAELAENGVKYQVREH
ncbi:hypothetical protein BDR26DRAFT_806005 [Obelidium mucronatum]|nr:hypothetical protein BDR26DRAFT_806005 [Obelidium mucronatum]